MHNRMPVLATILIALAISGCTKSEDDVRKAQRATPDLRLMPANDPKFEAEYVADQSQVKLVAARTVSYEPLETFRGKAKSRSSDEETAPDDEQPKAKENAANKAGPARGAPQSGGSSGGPGFWTRVGMKGLMGGVPGAAPPGKPASKGDEPAAKENKTDKKDKSADAEESEDGESSDQESKDSDSDGN